MIDENKEPVSRNNGSKNTQMYASYTQLLQHSRQTIHSQILCNKAVVAQNEEKELCTFHKTGPHQGLFMKHIKGWKLVANFLKLIVFS